MFKFFVKDYITIKDTVYSVITSAPRQDGRFANCSETMPKTREYHRVHEIALA